MKDGKLMKVVGDVESMLNQQLLAPYISQSSSIFNKRLVVLNLIEI